MVGSFVSAAAFAVGFGGFAAGAGVALCCGFGVGFEAGFDGFCGVGEGKGSTALLKNTVPFEPFGSLPPRAETFSTPSFVMITMSLFDRSLAVAASRAEMAMANAEKMENNLFMAWKLIFSEHSERHRLRLV
jgi:hypothetical protein